MNRRRAVITGIGPITCIGHGRGAFWNAILAEKSGISRISSFDPRPFQVRCAGEILDWNPEQFFTPQRLKRLDRYAQFAVASAQLALADAGLNYSREQPQERVGVSFGTALGGVCKAEDQHIRYLKKGVRGVNPMLAIQVFGGFYASHATALLEAQVFAWHTVFWGFCFALLFGIGFSKPYRWAGQKTPGSWEDAA